MRLVFMGTPEFAVPSLEALAAAGHSIAGVITRPDRPRRHGAAEPEASPVGALAAARGWTILRPATLKDAGTQAAIRALAPEAIVVVAFGQLLPPPVLEQPPRGCVNLHASLLPRWRGAAPIARAVMAGETATGLSTMRMERGLDTGPVYASVSCSIGPEETAGELTGRMALLGAALLVATLEAIGAGTIGATPQDEAGVTWAPPLERAEAPIDWETSAAALAARIRGLNPWPTAETGWRGERLQLLRAVAETATAPAAPGTVPGTVVEAAAERLIVACGGGTRLRLLELRRPGRRALTAREAINGRLVGDGDRFTSIGG
ncbi:MAG TPA: methionyl-tRNA formyltransferase [Dongiaceae bacterium]|nr:methionyl-tRNA formyltransferase [Dongiaceae bacterium]